MASMSHFMWPAWFHPLPIRSARTLAAHALFAPPGFASACPWRSLAGHHTHITDRARARPARQYGHIGGFTLAFIVDFLRLSHTRYVNCNRLKQKALRRDNASVIEKSFGIMNLGKAVMFFYDEIQ